MYSSNKVFVFVLLFLFGYNSFSQVHPRVAGHTAVPGTESIYEGTLKFNNFGPTVPYIDTPFETYTDWRNAYEDYHYIPNNLLPGDEEFMNFRLLKPSGFDPNTHDPYPLIIMLHGAGEIGRFSPLSRNWQFDPDDEEYDNNGRNLIHAAWEHYYAAVENKHPNRPSAPWTNEYSFDGVVLFPQAHTDYWGPVQIEYVVGIVDQLKEIMNLDYNRIYIHGLSNGTVGVYQFLNLHPELIAAAAPISGADTNIDNYAFIPLFIANGGLDSNPSPSFVNQLIASIETTGRDVIELPEGTRSEVNEDPYNADIEKYSSRHWYIPNEGHGVWDETYRRRDFFQWLLSKSKKDIFLIGGDPTYCISDNSFSKELRFGKGFTGYLWYKDDVIIPGATSWAYTANESNLNGSTVKYEVKYSRIESPNPADPADWETSNPIFISPPNGVVPQVVALSSTILPSHVNSINSVTLQINNVSSSYEWYNGDGIISGQTGNQLVVSEEGTYQARMYLEGGCTSDLSAGIFVKVGNEPGAPSTPGSFTATLNSGNSIQLDWSDVANELGYELYYSESPEGPYNLLTITEANIVSYFAENLEASNNYIFYLRAINNYGGSDYKEVVINSESDITAPELPENIYISDVTASSIEVSWDEATDNLSGIDFYELYLDEVLLDSTSLLSYVFTDLSSATIYDINLRVKDNAGNYSPISSQLSAATTGATLPSPPAIPTGLFASESNGLISLVWNDQSSETGYEVFRSLIDGGPYSIIGSNSANDNSYVDSDITSGVTYYYVVKAKIDGAVSGASDQVSYIAPNRSSPNLPTNLSLLLNNQWSNPSDEGPSISLSWDSGGNSDYFIIERSINDETNYVAIGMVDESITNFTDINISAEVVFYYRIKAGNSSGLFQTSSSANITSDKLRYFVNIATPGTPQVGGAWNDYQFYNFDVGNEISLIRDNYGNTSSIGLELVSSFQGSGTDGVNGNTIFPDNAMSSYHYSSGGNNGELKISGLEHGIPYNIYFMASTSAAWATSEVARFTANGSSTVLEAKSNDINLAPLLNILPDIDDAITIQISPNEGSTYGFLNALVIEKGDLTTYTDFYAKSESDISKLYNWGIYPDGTGGELKSFNENGKNMHITGNVHLVSDINITGTGTTTMFDGSTTMNIWDEAQSISFADMNLAESSMVSLSAQTDTCNLKILNGDLVLENNAILDIGSNTLTIGENNVLNPGNSTGSISSNNGNIVILSRNGSTSNLNLSSPNDSIAELTIDLGGGGVLNINNQLNLTSNLKLYTGQINTNDNLTLVSGENIDASILKIESGAAILGDVEYQRFWSRPIGSYGFFYIGSPIEGQTIADWIGEFHIQGVGTSSWKNLNIWNETTSQWSGIDSETETISPGVGINAFMFSSNFADEYIRYNNIGHVIQGDFQFDLSYTGTASNPGWNLVANPYPSAIDWSKIGWGSSPQDTINNVDAAIYIWDQSQGSYKTWSGGGGEDPVIASGQGFFIHTNNSNANPIKLIVTENIKVDQKPEFLRESVKENILKIVATDKLKHEDRAYISLIENATDGFDSHLDALKLEGSFMNLSSLGENGNRLAINALPLRNHFNSIPLVFESSATGIYSLTFQNVSTFGGEYDLILFDTYMNKQERIQEGTIYQFEIDENETSSGENRFRIEINLIPVKVTVKGLMTDVYGNPINKALISVVEQSDNLEISTTRSSIDGDFELELYSNKKYLLNATKSEVYSRRTVNLIDYLVLNWYIRGWKTNLSDYEFLSADVDKSGKIDKADLKLLRNLLRKGSFKNEKFHWDFVSSDYTLERKKYTYQLNSGLEMQPDYYKDQLYKLTGLISGDVYQDIRPANKREFNDSTPVIFSIGEGVVRNGHFYLPVYSKNFREIAGFKIDLDSRISGITGGSIKFEEESLTESFDGEFVLLWASGLESPVTMDDGTLLFYLQMQDKPNRDDFILSLNSKSHIVSNAELQTTNLVFENISHVGIQNAYLGAYPNPFNHDVKFQLKLVSQEIVTFTFYNSNGKLIHSIEKDLPVGMHELELHRDLGLKIDIPNGMTIFNVKFGDNIITDKLIRN